MRISFQFSLNDPASIGPRRRAQALSSKSGFIQSAGVSAGRRTMLTLSIVYWDSGNWPCVGFFWNQS
jgi:hypothetical protein